jgi:glycosyltransferase involved in cell wall biosynthesis
MKILILTDYYPPDKLGGVGEISRQLQSAYRALGHTVFVATTGEPRVGEIEDGILRSAKSLILGVLLNNLHVLSLIRRERIAVVHMHQSSSTLFLLARPFFATFPYVLDSLQVSYLSEAREIRSVTVGRRRFRPRLREYLERIVFAPAHVVLDFIGYALSDRVTVVSRENHDELVRTFGRLKARPVAVVPNGVPPAPAAASGFRDEALEKRLTDKIVLSYVGVFRIRKRVHTLLLAMRDVALTCPDAVLLLVGSGRGYDEELRALAAELAIDKQVIFVGGVSPERVRYYLSLTDVFCLLSSYEGMPVAMLEAMNEGKAVVATDGYGMRDLLSSGGSGVLVPVDDLEATTRALTTLVQHPEHREVLGRTAQSFVRSQLSWGVIAEQYLQLVASR